MNLYDHAPEAQRIAERLIDEEPVHMHLRGLLVLYVWRAEATVTGGRIKLGTARKVGGLSAFLIRSALRGGEATAPPEDTPARRDWKAEVNLPLFVVEFARDEWRYLNPQQRTALVDHELCHLDGDRDDPAKIGIVSHDVEEFYGIIRRHGLWKPDIAEMAEVMGGQLSLLTDGADQHLRDQAGDES